MKGGEKATRTSAAKKTATAFLVDVNSPLRGKGTKGLFKLLGALPLPTELGGEANPVQGEKKKGKKGEEGRFPFKDGGLPKKNFFYSRH